MPRDRPSLPPQLPLLGSNTEPRPVTPEKCQSKRAGCKPRRNGARQPPISHAGAEVEPLPSLNTLTAQPWRRLSDFTVVRLPAHRFHTCRGPPSSRTKKRDHHHVWMGPRGRQLGVLAHHADRRQPARLDRSHGAIKDGRRRSDAVRSDDLLTRPQVPGRGQRRGSLSSTLGGQPSRPDYPCSSLGPSSSRGPFLAAQRTALRRTSTRELQRRWFETLLGRADEVIE